MYAHDNYAKGKPWRERGLAQMFTDLSMRATWDNILYFFVLKVPHISLSKRIIYFINLVPSITFRQYKNTWIRESDLNKYNFILVDTACLHADILFIV